MFPTAIDERPDSYLHRIGHVFARFGTDPQAAANASYGVVIDGRRYFVKTAPIDDRTTAFYEAWREASSITSPSVTSRST